MATIQLALPALRAQRRLSQRQLAALAGVRPDTISALERGETHGIQVTFLAIGTHDEAYARAARRR